MLGAKTAGTSERLIEASPKSPTPIVPPEIASVNEAVLTIASAKPAAERSCGALHALPVHVERLMVGVPLPPKSYEMSRSPAVRLSVTAPTVEPVKPTVGFWLSSKSMCASPVLFARIQAR